MLKKPLPGQYNGPTEFPFSDIKFLESYPTLHEYLTCTQWDARTIRTTSTLLFFVENGVMKVCLNDRDNNRSAFFTAPTMEELMSEMEVKLASEKVDWRTRSRQANQPGYTPF